MLRLAKLLIILSLVTFSICAQEKEQLGWDLTYKSVLNNNNASKDWISQWLNQSQSPIEKWISEWRAGKIVSSILIEFPGFHAGERTTLWFVCSEKEAYYYEWVEGKQGSVKRVKIKKLTFDTLFQKASSWKQLRPKPASKLLKGEIPGYFGFLNIFDDGKSRQQLLTIEDFFICLNPKKGCEQGPGKVKFGRLGAALDSILDEGD